MPAVMAYVSIANVPDETDRVGGAICAMVVLLRLQMRSGALKSIG